MKIATGAESKTRLIDRGVFLLKAFYDDLALAQGQSFGAVGCDLPMQEVDGRLGRKGKHLPGKTKIRRRHENRAGKAGAGTVLGFGFDLPLAVSEAAAAAARESPERGKLC